jgi:hypothetical protein
MTLGVPELLTNAYTIVTLPDVGPAENWRASLQVPPGGHVEACAAPRVR